MKPLFLFMQNGRLVEEYAQRMPPPELILEQSDLRSIASALRRGEGVYFFRDGGNMARLLEYVFGDMPPEQSSLFEAAA